MEIPTPVNACNELPKKDLVNEKKLQAVTKQGRYLFFTHLIIALGLLTSTLLTNEANFWWKYSVVSCTEEHPSSI